MGGDIGRNIVAGIFMVLVLFWLFAPGSRASATIGAISGGVIGTIGALQGNVPSGQKPRQSMN